VLHNPPTPTNKKNLSARLNVVLFAIVCASHQVMAYLDKKRAEEGDGEQEEAEEDGEEAADEEQGQK
jgi:hypothetical protein